MAARRGVKLVLTLITLAIIVSMTGLAIAYFLIARGPSVPANATLVLRVRGGLIEIPPGGVLGQLFAAPPTVRSVVDNLRKAAVDSRVARVIIVPSGSQALWGKVQEVRDAIIEFKQSGKPIDAYLEYGGDQQYYLATAADRIFLMPTSPLDLTGMARYELFLRGTFDKIGAYPDLMHIGDYKTAANLFTERTFTPAHREMAESLNADMYDQLVRGIADGRQMTELDVQRLIDQGPFLPDQAIELGLVDELAYEDQIDEDETFRSRIEGDDYAGVSLRSVGLNDGPKVAVIYAVGVINTGGSRYDSSQGAVVGSETLVGYLRGARADPSIRAIVLRVDSPGGSAIASDVIWREVMLTRDEKPIVASMSDLAASGGYYIAMPAHAVVAQPATLTGSIGVMMGKVVFGGTYGKLGANVESVSEGRYAEINSPVRPYSPDERAKIEMQMQAVYDAFVEKAADARNTTPERIHAVAQGRVWTGQQGKQIGLVDELGGLERALALAKQRAGIPPDAEVEIVVYPPPRPFYELLRNPLGSLGGPFEALLPAADADVLRAVTMPLSLFNRGEPLALMPYAFLR